MMTRRLALALVLAGLAGTPAAAQEKLDWATLGRIRDEGFRHSQVMETAGQLTDVHGPRLTGSPQYKKAAEWARQQLETWGLANAHLESWPFGRGWSFERCSAHVVSPMSFPLVALPEGLDGGDERPGARQGAAGQGRVGGRRREAEGQDRGDGPVGGRSRASSRAPRTAASSSATPRSSSTTSSSTRSPARAAGAARRGRSTARPS